MAQATATATSLYKRLGGYDAIAAFTDQWLGRALADPPLAAYFKGMSNDTKGKARQLIVDFIASSLGGPTIYTGRTMKVLHEGLGISAEEYAAITGHAADTLDALGVPADAKAEFLAWFASLEDDTVERR
jgi:hemoglobin